MRKLLIIIPLWLTVQAVSAQEQKTARRLADEYYARNDYARAATLYKKLAAKKKVKTIILARLADCYNKMNAYGEAADWYALLLARPDAPAESDIYYGDILKNLGKYDDAKKVYSRYRQKTGQTAGIADRIAGCDAAQQWMTSPTGHVISNAGRLNTTKSDWGAAWYQTGIIFMSDSVRYSELAPGSKVNRKLYGRNNHGFYKLYLTDTGRYGAVYIKDFTSAVNQYQYHVGPVAFRDNYRTAFFTVDNPARKLPAEREKYRNSTIKHGSRRLELFTLEKDTTGRWTGPASFPYNKPDAYSLGHAAFSPDGQVLYFTSDMPGGEGATDIWYSERMADGSWGTPRNCGKTINTPEREAFPTVAPDGTLYFSSQGHAGMGGFDIFKTTGAGSQWSIPENMRYPINSPGDDFQLIWNENGKAFLTSNRSGGHGDDDIYVLAMPFIPNIPVVKPSPLIPVQVSVCPPFRGACIYVYNRQRQIGWCYTEDANGKFVFNAEPETDYVVRFTTAAGTDSVEVNTRGRKAPEPIQLDACPAKLIRGATFFLRHQHLDNNKAGIRPDAARELDSLAGILRAYPAMRIALGVHTYVRDNEAYNLRTSRQRAAAAVDYLVKAGIARNRLVANGYGSSQLINHCKAGAACTNPHHEQIRQMEVRVLQGQQ